MDLQLGNTCNIPRMRVICPELLELNKNINKKAHRQ